MKQPLVLLRALKHLLLFHFSFLMILGGYPSGIKGGKKQLKLCPSFMLSKALGKALNHTLYHNWAYAQLHLIRALIPLKPKVSCFTYIYKLFARLMYQVVERSVFFLGGGCFMVNAFLK